MRMYSLRTVIVRQWSIFAASAAVLLCSGTLLVSYLVEDFVIDRELINAEAELRTRPSNARTTPPAMQVLEGSDIPVDIADRAARVSPRETFEMRRPDGRYIHAMRLSAGKPVSVLVYDASESIVVSSLWPSGLTIALVVTALFTLAASVMANALASRIVRETEQIARDLDQMSDPAELRAIASSQRIAEIAKMLSAHAELWAKQEALIEAEKTNLSYLGHELRTPMQAAINAHALLLETPGEEAAMQRLTRALARLRRANAAVLWMASGKAADSEASVDLAPVLSNLLEELAPLAQWRKKQFEVEVIGTPQQMVPREVVEVIFANLLRNGVDHAASPTVSIRLSMTDLRISNRVEPDTREAGFGLGLRIAARLCEQSGWALHLQNDGSTFHACLGFRKN